MSGPLFPSHCDILISSRPPKSDACTSAISFCLSYSSLLLWLLFVAGLAGGSGEIVKGQQFARWGETVWEDAEVEEPDGGSEGWKEREREMTVQCSRNFK